MQSSTATKARASKPEATEYLPYYARYISLVAAGDVLQSLASQMRETQSVLRAIPASMSTHRYAPEKWSVNQLVGHVTATSRGERTHLVLPYFASLRRTRLPSM